MTLFKSVKGTFNTAVDTVATVAQSLVDKNRTNAKLNRLRLVMKNESELMNRAYITLGKQYYENAKNNGTVLTDEHKKLFELIENSKAKIAKARDCYRKIVDSQNDIFYGTTEPVQKYDSADIVDITVACSNENEYKSSPFENTVDNAVDTVKSEIKEDAAEIKSAVEKAVETPEIDKDDDTESTDTELF